MIIPKDLQSAIRAAAQGVQGKSWEQKERDRKAAIEEFLRLHPAAAKIIKRARHDYEKHEKAKDKAAEIINRFGIRADMRSFSDEGTFRRKGGAMPQDGKFTFNQVMAELIVAAPKEMHRILAKYGINWK